MKNMPKKALVIGVLLVLAFSGGSILASEATGSFSTTLESGLGGTLRAAPTPSPAAAEYHANQSVTLTASGSSAICYTTDSTTPACATSTTCTTGTKYASAISVTATTTIKSIACYSDATAGSVATSTYTLTCTTATIANGTVSAYPTCAITCNSGYSLVSGVCQAVGGGGGGGGSATPSTGLTTVSVAAIISTTAGGTTPVATTATGGTAKAVFPTEAVTASTTISITPAATTADAVAPAIAAIPSAQNLVGGYLYNYSAVSGGQTVATFAKPITLTLTYTDSQISGLNESSLTVNYWDGTKWVALATTVNAATNTLTAETTHFSYFAIMGQKAAAAVKTVAQMTVAELQAEITKILALIQQLQAKLAAMTGTPAQAAAAAFASDLEYGMANNSEVTRLQDFLISKGYLASGLNTGSYYSKTAEAVKAYQTAKGIAPANGRCGPKTRAAINLDMGVSQ